MKKTVSAIIGTTLTLAFAGVSLFAASTPAPGSAPATKSTKKVAKKHSGKKATGKSVAATKK